MRALARRAALVACAVLLVACGGHGGSGSSGAAQPGADGSSAASAASVPGGDWTRFNYDAQRSGVGPANTGIIGRNLTSLRRRRVHLDGTVDSSAIALHAVRVRGRKRDVIVVSTAYGRTIAIAARTGTKLWEYVPSDIRSYEGSSQITNTTPVADPGRRYVYAATPDGRIRKLLLATGREVRRTHWPARITFDATREKIAAALNLSGRYVIAVTGGYLGDAPTYQGHVVLIDRFSGRIKAVWNSLCSNRHYLLNPPRSCPASDAAIWARAGALIEPGSGRILIATGNGPFNGYTNWGDSVLELAPDASRLLRNWTPTDQAQLKATDTDVGSTAPALLAQTNGLRLAVQGGKDGKLRLLDLDHLNGTSGGPSAREGGELQRISTPGSGPLFTAPVVWSHGGRTYLFAGDDSGTAAYVLVAGHRPRLRFAWQNGTPATSPVLAGGLLYAYNEVDGALKVYEPTSGRLLASLGAATGHWNSPIVVGGRIVLPEGNANDHSRSGTLDIFHLPGR